MEKWLNRYGRIFNYSAIEIELNIPGGTLLEAQMNEEGIPEEWQPKIEAFLDKMREELVEQNANDLDKKNSGG